MKADELGPMYAERKPQGRVVDADFTVVRDPQEPTGVAWRGHRREPLIKSWRGLVKFVYWFVAAPLMAAWIGSHIVHALDVASGGHLLAR